MRDGLGLIVAKLAPRSRFERALGSIFSRAAVRSAADCCRSGGIVERLSLEHGLEPYQVLEELARMLQLPAVDEVVLPSPYLLSLCGHPPQALAEVPAAPQPGAAAGSRYLMAVADPDRIALDEYLESGVQVGLALGRDLTAMWERYRRALRSGALHEDESRLAPGTLQLLMRLQADAAGLGAQEVLIGCPTAAAYELMARGQRYRGVIGERAAEELRTLVEARSPLRIPASGWVLQLALRQGGSDPVVCFSWSRSAGCPHRGEQVSAPAILLVEDDPRFAEVLQPILRQQGYIVAHCPDAAVAFDCLEAESRAYSLVIADMHLPGLGGTKLLSLLQERHPELPVLVLTSEQDMELHAKAVCTGAAAYVRKDEDLTILLAWCANLLQRRPHAGES